MINPKVAIPFPILDKAELPNVPISHHGLKNPVENLPWDWLFFTDSSVFSPAANEFNKNKKLYNEGAFTYHLPGTSAYYNFWKEERERCINGYEPVIDGKPCGVRITGEHYFYLNYTQIDKYKKLPSGEEVKQLDFPDFTAMDYYWFLELERNENPEKFGLDSTNKKGMIVAKARRKGWSFKNAAGVAWKYTFFKKSYCIIASYGKDYAESTFKMCLTMLNFLDEYTEFKQPRLVNKRDEIEAGWVEKQAGYEIKKGSRAVIRTMTFKDSFSKSAGKSCTRMIFEEAGLFQNLIRSYNISEPLFRDGNRMIGIPIIFGTGGDMDKLTQDFAKMFYNPKDYGLASYKNIYDVDIVGECGYFVDELWYRPGPLKINKKTVVENMVDINGNAIRWAADIDVERERANKIAKNRKTYLDEVTQRCKTPAEAFLVADNNMFPTAELNVRIGRLRSEDFYKTIGRTGELMFTEHGVKFSHIPELEALHQFPLKQGEDRTGCLVIYEDPMLIEGIVPTGMYVIGHDPFAVDSDEAESLSATFVIKTTKYLHKGYDQIVAAYVGRPYGGNSMEKVNMTLEKLSMYYGNAKIMFENDRGSVLEYFTKRKKLHLLADEPGIVNAKSIDKRFRTSRIKGSSMGSLAKKQQGELYLTEWLLRERGALPDGTTLRNLDLIPDLGLLEELLRYNREGNFDRVSAMFQLMVILNDDISRIDESLRYNAENKQSKLDFLTNNRNLFPNAVRKTETFLQ
jgi:hypothetical protein